MKDASHALDHIINTLRKELRTLSNHELKAARDLVEKELLEQVDDGIEQCLQVLITDIVALQNENLS